MKTIVELREESRVADEAARKAEIEYEAAKEKRFLTSKRALEARWDLDRAVVRANGGG